MAKYFEEKVRSDDRFEIPAERLLGMVVFRVKVIFPEYVTYISIKAHLFYICFHFNRIVVE